MMKSSDARYGSMAVTLHWLSALLILILLITGFRAGFSADAAVKAIALTIHVPVAITVLLLTAWRLIWWWRFDRKPAPLGGAPHWQELTATWTHRALYLLLFVLLGSGIAMSAMSGLPFALFGDAPLPDLDTLPPRAPHGYAAKALAGLVLLHAGAALQHHFIAKDTTLRRLWFGRFQQTRD